MGGKAKRPPSALSSLPPQMRINRHTPCPILSLLSWRKSEKKAHPQTNLRAPSIPLFSGEWVGKLKGLRALSHRCPLNCVSTGTLRAPSFRFFPGERVRKRRIHKQTSVPHPFLSFLGNGWETTEPNAHSGESAKSHQLGDTHPHVAHQLRPRGISLSLLTTCCLLLLLCRFDLPPPAMMQPQPRAPRPIGI